MKEQILTIFREIPGIDVKDFHVGDDGYIYLDAIVVDPTVNRGLIEASLARVINQVNKEYRDWIDLEKIKQMPLANILKC